MEWTEVREVIVEVREIRRSCRCNREGGNLWRNRGGGCGKFVDGAEGQGLIGRFGGTFRSVLVTRKIVEIELVVKVGFIVVTGGTVTRGAWSRHQLVRKCWRKRICGSRNVVVVIHVRSNRAEPGSRIDYLGETRTYT